MEEREKSKPVVSVIIPVYNLENYLDTCLDSVGRQTYGDFEAIVVDDGSTDGSQAVALSHAERDARIVVISTVNQGAARARETGIRHAQGDYICFLDGDDVWDSRMLEKLVAAIGENGGYDIVCCDYKRICKTYEAPKREMRTSDMQGLDFLVASLYHAISVTVWGRLYRRALFEKELRHYPLRLGEDSLLAGIIVNTALYSVNIAVMGGSSLINMNRTTTVFTMMKDALAGTALKGREDILIAAIAVILVIVFLVFFLKTRLGLAIRATGNNSDMVKSSSINPVFTTVIGLCVANAFTALSGCLLSQSQKSVDINIGQGMVTIALASLLIGGTLLGHGGIFARAVGMVLGSFIFRLVYTIALRFNMPAFMLKLVSSVIVVLAISGPYLKKQWPQIRRRMTHTKGGR